MSDHELRLVRLVTRRYRELQGLRTAVDAVSLLLLWALLQLPSASRRPVPYLLAVIGWAILAVCGEATAARFYRDRFGRAVAAGRGDSPAARVLWIWFVIVMGGTIGLVLPLLAVYAAIVVWRDWPYRSHWSLLVIAALAFDISFLALHAPAQFPEFFRRFVWTAAPLAAFIGLLDHRLLMRAMHAEALPDQEHADTI